MNHSYPSSQPLPYPPHQAPLPAINPPHYQQQPYVKQEQYMASQAQPAATLPPPSQQPAVTGSQGEPSQHESDSAPIQQEEQRSAEEKARAMRNLIPLSKEDHRGWRYSLEVVQQPQRARMCGFGDKDRRPITPPPCVKLVIRDKTGREVDTNEIRAETMVIQVDLWSADAFKEVNMVKSTSASPSISSTTQCSYAQLEQSTPAYASILPSNRAEPSYAAQVPYGPPSVNPYAMQPHSQYPGTFGQANGGYSEPNGGYHAPPAPGQYYGGGQPDFRPDIPGGMPQLPSQPHSYGPPRVYENPPYAMGQRLSVTGSTPQGMFTRNLIGNSTVNGFRLADTEDRIGIWFILQDLSVRTEGVFRLRFNFIDVSGREPGQSVNQRQAPILAQIYSEPFTVYSAKKFPGVCESTNLSKCFATQGIKIPIRKEGANGKGGGDDDDE